MIERSWFSKDSGSAKCGTPILRVIHGRDALPLFQTNHSRWRGRLDWRTVAGVNRFDQLPPIGPEPALQNAYATVPAQNRIVISMRPDCLSPFKVIKRFLKKGRHRVRCASSRELGLRLALVKNAGVIEPLVFVSQTLKSTSRLVVTICGTAVELIGDRKPEQTQCGLILRISSQYVAANRLGFARLV